MFTPRNTFMGGKYHDRKRVTSKNNNEIEEPLHARKVRGV